MIIISLLWIVVEQRGVHYFFARISIGLIIGIWDFIINKRITFK